MRRTIRILRQLRFAACALGLIAAGASTAAADVYPSQPIKAILPFTPGGLGDTVLRALAQGLTEKLGKPVIVESRPGANQQIGARACASAAPDGYTICMLGGDAVNASVLFKSVPYNPDTAFAPITNLFFLTEAMVVNPKLPVASVNELVALSKAKPNTLNYATPAISVELFMSNFAAETGADITKIAYKGGGDVVNAVVSGEVQVGYFGIGNMMGHLQAGTIKPLAVDSVKRSPLLPDVPTLAETGYKGAANRAWFGLFAPAGTPKAIMDKLHAAVMEVAGDPSFKEKTLVRLGLDPVLNTSDEFKRFLMDDRREVSTIVGRTGFTSK